MTAESVSHRMLFLRNVRWALISMVLRYGVSFGVTLLLAKSLGAETFGEYQYYLSIFAIVESLAMFLNSSVVSNELISGRLSFPSLWGSVRIAFPLIVVAVLAALWGLARTDVVDLEPNLLIFLHLALFFKLADFLGMQLIARLEQHVVQICDIGVVLIFNLARLLVIWNEWGIEWLVACTLLQYALTFGGLAWVFLRRSDLSLRGRFDGSVLAGLWAKSLPMYGIAVLAVLQTRVSNLIIPEMLSTRELGLFAFASKMMEPLIAVGLLPLGTALPFLSHSYRDSREIYWNRMQRLLGLTTLGGLMIAALVWLVPLRPILTWVSADFVAAEKLFPLLALALLGQGFASLCNLSDVLTERTSRALMRYVLIVVVQALLSVLLIREAGLFGAAMATLLGPLAVNLVYNLTFEDGRRMNMFFFSIFSRQGLTRTVAEAREQLLSTLGRRKP